MQVLALDVGLSSVKAALLDVGSAAVLGEAALVPFELEHPGAGAAQVIPEKLWSAVAAAARKAMRGVEEVDGVGLSCVAPGLVLLDARDQPLSSFWMPRDRRSRLAARQVWAAVGEEFLAETGSRPLPGGVSAVCYRQQLTDDPYVYRNVRSYLHLNGWLGLRLTGRRAIDRANASLSGLYGTLTDQRWSPRWCEFFNLEPDWLPPVVDGSATLGPLLPAVAAELNVPPGLPVKLGTTDVSSAVLAAEMRPGDLLHDAGVFQVLAAVVEKPAADVRRQVHQLGVGAGFVHLTHDPVGLPALDWLHALCFRDQAKDVFFSATLNEVLERQTRVTLDPPNLAGDWLEIDAHRAAFRDLALTTDRMDLLAAVVQELRRQHQRAPASLGTAEHFERIFLAGANVELLRRLYPECSTAKLSSLEDGALRGVAWLFREQS